MGIKHVRGTTTTLNGCKVEIDGDVKYGLIPPRIIGFHGVVRISGGLTGPNGDLYFGFDPEDRIEPTLPAVEKKP